MKIFITGGTGFMGRRVVSLLKKRKHVVRLMKARLEELDKAEKEIKRFKPDVVIHLAWEGLPDYGATTSAKNLSLGVLFLSLLARIKIKKVVVTGSCFEYDNENSGHWAYTVAKGALRDLGREFFRSSGGVFVWAVPFFVYGAGKPAKSLFPSLIGQAERGETPVAKNDVALDFVYVDDVARALVFLAEKRVPSNVYDIGTGTLIRTVEVARVVARLYHVPPIPVRVARKHGCKADVQALKALGWKPKFSLEEGLKETVRLLALNRI